MGSLRDKYVELHSIAFDHENSACGSCTLEECGHYYDKCPQQKFTGKTIVTNAFSPGKMINVPEYGTRTKNISEKEFHENAKKALSHVGNKGIARRYGLRFNRKPILLVPGDDVYVVHIHGGRLPDSGIIPDDVFLTFQHVEVIS